jgi:hypothetical protein
VTRASFRNSTLAAEHKCTDLAHHGIKIDVTGSVSCLFATACDRSNESPWARGKANGCKRWRPTEDETSPKKEELSKPIKAKCHLEDMGPEKYKKAIEHLLAGVLAATVVREISKEFPSVPLPLLAQKLRRARAAAEVHQHNSN